VLLSVDGDTAVIAYAKKHGTEFETIIASKGELAIFVGLFRKRSFARLLPRHFDPHRGAGFLEKAEDGCRANVDSPQPKVHPVINCNKSFVVLCGGWQSLSAFARLANSWSSQRLLKTAGRKASLLGLTRSLSAPFQRIVPAPLAAMLFFTFSSTSRALRHLPITAGTFTDTLTATVSPQF
jgi:hypothetical protein